MVFLSICKSFIQIALFPNGIDGNLSAVRCFLISFRCNFFALRVSFPFEHILKCDERVKATNNR